MKTKFKYFSVIAIISIVAFMAGVVHGVVDWALYIGIIIAIEIPIMAGAVYLADWMMKKYNL